jgi:hypothetical protein
VLLAAAVYRASREQFLLLWFNPWERIGSKASPQHLLASNTQNMLTLLLLLLLLQGGA